MRSFLRKTIIILLVGIGHLDACALEEGFIKEVESMDFIPFDRYKGGDLVAFDIDNTLITAERRIMRDVNAGERAEFIESIRGAAGSKRVSFVYNHSKDELLEDSVLEHIKGLKDNGVEVVAFTVRRTGIPSVDCSISTQDEIINRLHSLGVCFNSIHYEDIILSGVNPGNLEYREFIVDKKLRSFFIQEDAMAKEGVIFSNNIDKGIVLEKLFNGSQFYPSTFVMIDDKMENLLSMERAIGEINVRQHSAIRFHGYYYKRIFSLDNKVDERVVEVQKEYLVSEEPVFLSDEEALKVVEERGDEGRGGWGYAGG